MTLVGLALELGILDLPLNLTQYPVSVEICLPFRLFPLYGALEMTLGQIISQVNDIKLYI